MAQPLIGITLDSEEAGGYSPYPWYALRKDYFNAVAAHGAIPIALPHRIDAIPYYLDKVDALLIPGGDFDITPELYGQKALYDDLMLKQEQAVFCWQITEQAIARHMPLLGICAGQQLLNVILGGTLIQHIPDEVPAAGEHKQPAPRHTPWHDITITQGTLLHRITGKERCKVNSSHHQAVKTAGKDVVINAVADDGIIEGIEYPSLPFCLGVEWHPEYEACTEDTAIMRAFVAAASQAAA